MKQRYTYRSPHISKIGLLLQIGQMLLFSEKLASFQKESFAYICIELKYIIS